MKVCSLFSGIGGFELGLARAGFETIMMCENDNLARSVLHHQFPGIPIRKDVRAIKRLPKCDLLTAGWPCQDLSQAGKTAGLEGRSSGLIAEVFRLLSGRREKPEFVLLENVAFALHLNNGAALRFVTENFERLGYKWAYRILDSREFGLPQRRRRVFILGSLNVAPETVLFKGAGQRKKDTNSAAELFGFYWTEGNTGLGWSPEAVPPLKGGSSFSIPSPPAIWSKEDGNFFTPSIGACERMQGFPEDWTYVGQLKDEKSRSRWKLVGNAVSVPVAEWIGRSITESSLISTDLGEFETAKSPSAACGEKGKDRRLFRFEHEGSGVHATGRLRDFGLTDGRALSRRAALGFLGRIEKSTLRTDPRFVSDLRAFVV